ncbi:GntR family transcriptional regulator [Mesorhizobium sp. LjNodule214]|uniref:GntR family transcriptional regulator n=1 Tax=Mesorhizobium sp. LjNodule214 TaxID=3342252 RepID=UPI003ECD0D29
MARSRFKRKGNAKFIMIEGYIMRSAAWLALSANDRAAYLELKWRYDGLNNGRIGLGERELGGALHISRETARRALNSLVEKGFVARAKASGFNVKSRVATEWRLTEYRCDVSGHLSTKDFMR